MNMSNMCVIGAGRMGSLYGALLAKSGLQVTLYDPWGDTAAYDAQAHRLVQMFIRSFAKFETYVGENVRLGAGHECSGCLGARLGNRTRSALNLSLRRAKRGEGGRPKGGRVGFLSRNVFTYWPERLAKCFA
jgi:glycine/D-amino acid oxidase-like deaminating enzyme